MVHPNQHEQPSPAPPVPTSPAAETAHEASDCAKAKFPQQCTTTTTTVHTNNANTTETRDESETAGETGTGRRLHVETKADWGAIYTQPTPVPYYTTMTPYDYGHYHDRLLEMLPQEIERVFPSPASPACPMMDDGKGSGSGSGSAPVLRVVEFGASYGNTTLGYRHGLDWQAVGQVWLADGEAHDQAPSGMGAFAPLPRETRPMHVTAVDLSGPALAYGKRKGLYDETVEVDFNQVQLPLRLVEALGRADVLVLVMVSSYITTLSLQRIFLSFLSGAGGGGYSDGQKKLLVYNDTCAFDTRNLSPSALLAGVKGWTAKQRFTKHRDFTEEERQKQHGCRESWSYTYLVEFADLDQNENRNAH